MLFGDGEEEEYPAESGNMYGFKPEDSSYSESSDPDCCSEGSEEGTQQQSVSNGQFNACSSSAEGTNVTAPHYCIPGKKDNVSVETVNSLSYNGDLNFPCALKASESEKIKK